MTSTLYRFGEFRLDAATRQLWRGAEPVSLPPKVFDCIVYLVEHRERAVGRDELIAAVWGKVDITDSVLGQTILQARRALDDTGKEQGAIRTVLRFGYHWVAAVDVLSEPAPAAIAPVDAEDAARAVVASPPISRQAELSSPTARVDAWIEAPPSPAAAQGRHRRSLMLALVVAAVSSLGLWIALATTSGRHGSEHAAAPAAKSDAVTTLVLPVRVATTGDAHYTWVRLGVMDLIAERLRAAGQPVVPSDNVVALARQLAAAPSANEIAELARAASAALVVDARAEHLEHGWRVSLATPYGRTPPLSASGESDDVLDAARDAADQLALLLGRTPPTEANRVDSERALATLLRQVDAAMLSDQLDVARQLLESASPAQRDRPEVRFRFGQIDYQAGRLDLAERTFQQLIASISPEQDAELRARAFNGLGAVSLRRQDYPGVERNYDASVQLLDAHHPRLLGIALNGRAVGRGAQRRYDTALADFAQARIALENAGDSLGLATLDANLGSLDMSREHFAEAAPTFDRAAERAETLHDRIGELNARTNAAKVQINLLNPGAALANDRRLAQVIAEIADPSRRRDANLLRVEVLIENGQLRAAADLLQKVRGEAAAAKDGPALAEIRTIDTERLLAAGEFRRAADEATAVLAEQAAEPYPRSYSWSWLALVRARLADGDRNAAAKALADFGAWAQRDGTPVAQLYLTLARAELGAANNEAGASADYDQALAAAETARVPRDLFYVSDSYVRYLIHRHELAQASVVAERLSTWAGQDYATALLQLRLYHAAGLLPAWRAALNRVRALAGERTIPPELVEEPHAADTKIAETRPL